MENNSQNNSYDQILNTKISDFKVNLLTEIEFNCRGIKTFGDFLKMSTIDMVNYSLSKDACEDFAQKIVESHLLIPSQLENYLILIKEKSSHNMDTYFLECEQLRFNEGQDDWEEDFLEEDYSESDRPIDEREAQKQLMLEITSKAKQLQESLSNVIFGQDNAIDLVTEGYFKALLSEKTENNRSKPLATYLFAGSPGVGKTFMAEEFAKQLKLPFMRFDMSEYVDKEAPFEFIGSDKVYKNGKCGNVTGYVHENPKCVLLFDEIEKAHINVIHLFLQMLDRGCLRDNYTDIEVSFVDTIVIFTTNAGKQLYEDNNTDLSTIPRNVVIDALSKDVNFQTGEPFFPPAICSRFASGNVILFNHITAPDLYQIVKKEMYRNAKNIEGAIGVKIGIDDNVYSSLLFSQGARLDARTIKSRSENFVVTEIFNLLRLVSEKAKCTSKYPLKNVNINASLPTGNDEIDNLFFPNSKMNILLFGEDDMVKYCEKALDFCNTFSTKSFEEAKNIFNRNDIDIILIDPASDKTEELPYLNKEDIESTSRSFRKYLQAYAIEQPAYLVHKSNYKMNSEEKRSFIRSGIKGFLRINQNKTKKFADRVKSICNEAYIQKSVNKLTKTNKCLTFDVKQEYLNGIAKITLYDFTLATNISAEDRNSVLEELSRPDVSFNDIVGARAAKEELQFFIEYLKNPKQYVKSGARTPRGVLLYGPPGTGKTMLAKAMAGESGVTFIATEGNKFQKKYAGEGQAAVHKLFATAKKYSPTIVFVDEIDAIAKERTGSEYGGEGTLTAFLTEMDGFTNDPKNPVFVLAATNYGITSETHKCLDSAFVRRFDRSIFVDLPGKNERIEYILRKVSSNSLFDISEDMIENIAVRSTEMSLAGLEMVLEMALREAFRRGLEKVTDEILENSFETMRFGEEKSWDKEQILRIARHECGHALVSQLSGNKPTYITIISRGNHGGYVQHAGNEKKAIYTKDEMLAQIRIALAGRASEMVYYGEESGVSTGASSDLASAAKIAHSMICDYGMDSEIGFACLCAESANSETVSNAINNILQNELQNAKKAIETNKDIIDILTDELIKKDHLIESEINEILK